MQPDLSNSTSEPERRLRLVLFFPLGRLARFGRFGRPLLDRLRRRRRHRDAIHFLKRTALEMVDAGARSGVEGQHRGAVAVWQAADLHRTRLAGAEHDVAFAHAERNTAAEQRGGVRGRRGRSECLTRRRWRSWRNCRRRTGSVAVDQLVRRNRALLLLGFLQFRKGITTLVAGRVEWFGKPTLGGTPIDVGTAGKRQRQRERYNHAAWI